MGQTVCRDDVGMEGGPSKTKICVSTRPNDAVSNQAPDQSMFLRSADLLKDFKFRIWDFKTCSSRVHQTPWVQRSKNGNWSGPFGPTSRTSKRSTSPRVCPRPNSWNGSRQKCVTISMTLIRWCTHEDLVEYFSDLSYFNIRHSGVRKVSIGRFKSVFDPRESI